MMLLRKLSLLSFLLATPLIYGQTAPTQTWFTVTPENAAVSVTLPAGTTYRFGDYTNNKWSASITVNVATTISPVSMANGDPFPFSDPDYGTVKEFDILETPAAQTVTVTNSSAATTVAQAVPPLVPPTTIPVPAGSAYTLTFSNFSTPVGSAQNALMLTLVNAPASGANRAWQGTQMNLTVDGVTFTCTYGQTYTDQVFTMNCAVPTP